MDFQKYYNYWNDRGYRVGKIKFIETTRSNPQRKFFVDWVSDSNNIKSVLEIGPGEMIEYQMLRYLRGDIKYSITDVCSEFIRNCKERFPQVDTYKIPAERLNELDKEFDCVYESCVFEHSPDVKAAIKNSIKLAKHFHFVFFRWRWKGGGLKSRFFEKKNLCSSTFNIWKILEEIEKYGIIEHTNVMNQRGTIYSLEEYRDISRRVKQRDGNWLAIHGRRK